MSYACTTLANGTQVVTAALPRRDSVAVGLWVRAGGRYEPARIAGIFHFLEHLLFKGTRRRTCQEIKTAIEGVGGSMNGFTSEEYTCYLAKLPVQYFATALDVLADMVFRATLAPVDIRKERPVIVEEIRMYYDQPAHHVHDVFNELLWPRHPLGMPLAGTPQTVERITRQDLARYQRQYYTPANVVVAVAGSISPAQVIRQIHQSFPTLRGRSAGPFRKARRPDGGPRAIFVSKDTEQVHLCLGTHALPRLHLDRFALDLLHILLGANMSSRLFQAVREDLGLAYDIGTHIKRYRDTGAFVVHAGCDREKVVKAVQVIVRELGRIKRSGVGAQEFGRAKDYYIGQLLMGLEDTMEQMLWIGEHALTTGHLVHRRQVLEGIRQVAPADVQRVARRLFRTEELHLALIGKLDQATQRQLEHSLRIP